MQIYFKKKNSRQELSVKGSLEVNNERDEQLVK